jgi:hypothetical protein
MDFKYDNDYAIANYNKLNGIITRKIDSPVEPDKNVCLRSMLKIFTNSNYEFIPTEFTHVDGPIRNSTSRCICSQRRNKITHHIIKHKETGLQFKVGKDCFDRLFPNNFHQEILDFYKKPCKYCKEIIQKKSDDRPDFCTKKCKEFYEDLQEDLEHHRWIIERRLVREAKNADNEMTPLMKWEHIQFERLIKFNAL